LFHETVDQIRIGDVRTPIHNRIGRTASHRRFTALTRIAPVAHQRTLEMPAGDCLDGLLVR
jgi:hypothetical protein